MRTSRVVMLAVIAGGVAVLVWALLPRTSATPVPVESLMMRSQVIQIAQAVKAYSEEHGTPPPQLPAIDPVLLRDPWDRDRRLEFDYGAVEGGGYRLRLRSLVEERWYVMRPDGMVEKLP